MLMPLPTHADSCLSGHRPAHRPDPADPAAPLATTPSAALAEALDATAHCGPEDDAGLANHLPMVLQALDALGADAARLRRQLAVDLPRFSRPMSPLPPCRLQDWTARRGETAADAALAAHFAAELSDRGAAAVLREVLPALFDGVATAAFHGLIRTAHAVQAGHPPELSRALAHWASRWRALPRPEAAAPLALGDWLAALDAADGQPRPTGRLIIERITTVVKGPAYAVLAGRLHADGHTLDRLSLRAAHAYRRDGDFTRLHLVTSARALRVLSPWLSSPAAAVGRYADAFAAAWLASGGPVAQAASPGEPGEGAAPDPWPALVAQALASDDDHVIKLVHACRDEAARHHPMAYRRCAARALA